MNPKERTILRDLARRVAELAADEKQQERIENWTRLDGLDPSVRPQVLVHLWPLAWGEVLPDSVLQCEDRMARWYERWLRQTIWIGETLDSDGVVEPVIPYPLAMRVAPYGDLKFQYRYADGDKGRGWGYAPEHGAAEFVPVINEKRDIEKLGDPKVEVDERARERNRQQACEIFSPWLTPVKQPYAPSAKVADEFSWLRGMENTYADIVEDPAWAHEALDRIARNIEKRFDMLEKAGVWGVAHKSNPLGSAGLRFAPGLPDWRTAPDPTTFAPMISESWGFTCAEVFTCVSPAMHDEFSFEYDRRLMARFKYVNVGCCETLDRKMEQVRSLPNVRKVSVSEWCDVDEAARGIGGDYVYSYRAAGVPFVSDPWDRESARKEISAVLRATREHGCPLEIVLNIGGTLGPGDAGRKLVEWCRLVRELLESES